MSGDLQSIVRRPGNMVFVAHIKLSKERFDDVLTTILPGLDPVNLRTMYRCVPDRVRCRGRSVFSARWKDCW